MELTPEEIRAIEKPTAEVVWDDYKVLSGALKKFNAIDDKKHISICQTRAALAIERSTRPHYEKSRHFEAAARKASEAKLPCAHLFALAADYIGRDLGHAQAANLFREAATRGVNENLDMKFIHAFYMSCRRHFDLSGDSAQASLVFVEEANLRLKTARKREKPFLFIYKILSNYGESPKRVALFALTVILGCSLFYSVHGIQPSSLNDTVYSFPTSLYFSVVTFTTLGYGDFSPLGTIGRMVACLEALSGLILTSLFLVTVVRKYSR